MAMQIDKKDIKKGTLTFKEAKYLKDRGRLPADYEMPEDDTLGEDEDEDDELPSRVTPLEEQQSPTIANAGGIVPEEGEEDYEEGWNNDQRRAELSKRGLSVTGAKSDLINRLRRSDTGQTTDDDLSEVG